MIINIAKLRENGFNVDVNNDGYGGEPETIHIYPGDGGHAKVFQGIHELLGTELSGVEKDLLVDQFLNKYNNRVIMKLCDE